MILKSASVSLIGLRIGVITTNVIFGCDNTNFGCLPIFRGLLKCYIASQCSQ